LSISTSSFSSCGRRLRRALARSFASWSDPRPQSFWRWTLLGRPHSGWGDVRLQVAGDDVRPRRQILELREDRGLHAITAKVDNLLCNLYQFTGTIDNA